MYTASNAVYPVTADAAADSAGLTSPCSGYVSAQTTTGDINTVIDRTISAAIIRESGLRKYFFIPFNLPK
jgi:hypothetical protein